MTASANPFASLGLADPRRTAQQGNALRQGAEQSSQRLGQKDFLKLMITQFKNQDPTHPMQDGQFLGQLAQFGTVSGIQQLQGSFSTLADSLHSEQAMRAATLVGHRVMAASDSANLSTGGSLNGAVDVPDGGGHVKLTISDSTGHKVKQIDLGTQPGGLADFAWDGRAADGTAAAPGTYKISAELVDGDGSQALKTMMSGKVESVSLADGKVELAVPGLGNIALGDVREIDG